MPCGFLLECLFVVNILDYLQDSYKGSMISSLTESFDSKLSGRYHRYRYNSPKHSNSQKPPSI